MAIELSERDIEALSKIRAWEENADEESMRLGWQWFDVQVNMGTINKLLTMGLVERTYSSRSSKHHKLTEKAKAIMDGEENSIQSARESLNEPTPDILTHMFDDIVGYGDVKELICEGLQLEKPIHVLLVGPPAIAKTMFLDDIERVFAGRAEWFLGSGTSKVGLWERIAEKQPRIILIDELDKMKSTDYASLLSLMQSGRVTIAKHGKNLDMTLIVWVIACANRFGGMSAEFLSRFKIKRIEEYNASEFKDVVIKTLVMHEDIDTNIASLIALELVNKTHDVRTAVRVARLSKRVSVKRAVELIMS
jgi:Holliday junction DNA helicase RuvB